MAISTRALECVTLPIVLPDLLIKGVLQGELNEAKGNIDPAREPGCNLLPAGTRGGRRDELAGRGGLPKQGSCILHSAFSWRRGRNRHLLTQWLIQSGKGMSYAWWTRNRWPLLWSQVEDSRT